MPKISRTAVENRIKEVNPSIRPSDLRRVVKLHSRRHDAFTRIPTHEEALLLVKAIAHNDEPGDIAAGIRKRPAAA